ncbi:MAG: cobalamin B12-binding domain-containing protein [Alphaproteobacteria bacterium]|nr:cobalamin B12-binding domain-containing protein [Alphaproteobacteria bacterium]
MKVVLINPTMGDYYKRSKVRAAITLSPPLNLALLAGALRRAGHRVEVWDQEARPTPDIERALAEARPDLVGVTFRTPLFPQARRIAEAAARACPGALRVAGGVHPSTRPQETLARAPFDVAVRGEGDRSIVELAEGHAFDTIGGLTWPGGETPARPLIQDMDGLAFGAWDLFDLRRYRQTSLVAHTTPVADLESSRGCRARCVYCTKGVFGNLWRVKSPGRMVDELEHARAAGFRAFNFVDDSFTTLTTRAIETCEEMLRRDLCMPWTLTNGIRVANVNEEFFRVARRAGCYLLAFGFESGSDRVLHRIKKGATVRQARRAVAWARKYGFTILGYFMVGLPGETAETIQETADFAASLDVDFAKFSITMPLPGTPLYDQWAPHIRASTYDFSIHTPDNGLYDHPDFTWPELEAHTRAAYRTFYGRRDYVLKRVARSVRSGQLFREARYTAALGASGLMDAFGRR